MIEANIIVETKRKTSKGYAIKIEVYSKRRYKYIGLKKYQNSKTLKIDSEIANRLTNLEKEVEYCNKLKLDLDSSIEVIQKGLDNNPELEIFLLKQRIQQIQNDSGIKLLEFFDIRIKELKDLSKSIKAYEETKIQVKYFLTYTEEDDILINNIDYEWLQKFIRFKKMNTKQGAGGVNFYLKKIRAVYKEAQKRESLNIKKDNPFLGLINNETTKEVINIPIDDIKKLFQFIDSYKLFVSEGVKLSNNKGITKKNALSCIRAVELWLFQIAIGGFDFADIAYLKWKDIDRNRISFRRYKNRNKPKGGSLVDNMLSDFALYVIDKYGDKTQENVFSFIPDLASGHYIEFRNNIGKILNRVSDKLEFKERIRTKSPRYIYRSLAGELLIDTLVIMQIQGHKPEGVTYKYQRKLPYEVIDKEHQKVLDMIFTNQKK
ncbi:phage integrase SAM-like domain-containing protein [Aquimarina algiphila]|uniref:Site-specific integrase n=1 Tax=Aquimarina algiphila TaxID=2047982 RepID=A0A554VE58_9FLAO|nr:phage integrase SAM-like domain-containing protein [Aquimarina algiphila]TSE05263.1 site-specific integrase [Aquimarina algiphila]